MYSKRQSILFRTLNALCLCLLFVFAQCSPLANNNNNNNTKINRTRLVCTNFAPVNSTQLHQLNSTATNNTNNKSIISETETRRQFIVNITKEAWGAYVRHAWGQEALQPLSQNSDKNNRLPANGETIIQSITTLWLMGLQEEYGRARKWIDEEMNITRVKLENIGSLISAYSLTGDEMFKQRAKQVADYLHGQYNATALKAAKEASGFHKVSRLSEFLRQRLGFRYLGDITESPKKYWQPIQAIDDYFRFGNGQIVNYSRSSWLMLDVRAYIQLDRSDAEGLRLYNETLENMKADKKIVTSKSNLTFILDAPGKMNQISCGFGAFLSYGAAAMENVVKSLEATGDDASAWKAQIASHRRLASQITETCHLATNSSRLGLTTSVFLINSTATKPSQMLTGDGNHFLMPNILESYFVLYRFTGDERYRHYAWELAQAIYKHCRNENGGYSQIYRVNDQTVIKRDYQPSYFIGATLEYLYLIFSSDQLLPLKEWTFNVAGNPLPIVGKNRAWKRCR